MVDENQAQPYAPNFPDENEVESPADEGFHAQIRGENQDQEDESPSSSKSEELNEDEVVSKSGSKQGLGAMSSDKPPEQEESFDTANN